MSPCMPCCTCSGRRTAAGLYAARQATGTCCMASSRLLPATPTHTLRPGGSLLPQAQWRVLLLPCLPDLKAAALHVRGRPRSLLRLLLVRVLMLLPVPAQVLVLLHEGSAPHVLRLPQHAAAAVASAAVEAIPHGPAAHNSAPLPCRLRELPPSTTQGLLSQQAWQHHSTHQSHIRPHSTRHLRMIRVRASRRQMGDCSRWGHHKGIQHSMGRCTEHQPSCR